MKERYERIEKLRAAWNLRKNSTESEIRIVSRDLLVTTDAIDQVTNKLATTENSMQHFQDISFRYLVGMVDLRNKMLQTRSGLQTKRLAEASNERMCEIIEDKLNQEIKATQSAADLREILELLVRLDKGSG